ncbi:DUF1572 family protein [Ammoniphilus sp. 3BR4]|uniref:DUF1572 family protein n=1 Tax=Ammoniphilus sp. 3BR4 TaxID=3158265 RepID=UPI00346725E9
MDKNIANEYLNVVINNLNIIKLSGEKAIEQVEDSDLFWKPNERSNSIAIIIKHLHGNMISRWTDFLHTDGEKPDRNKDHEFLDSIITREELLLMWDRGWKAVFGAIHALTGNDLLKTVYIKNQPHSVVKAIQRQVYHYSYHIGQIVYIAKQCKSDPWKTLI